jgi:hypothetical protein
MSQADVTKDKLRATTAPTGEAILHTIITDTTGINTLNPSASGAMPTKPSPITNEIQAATTIPAIETAISEEIELNEQYDTICIYYDYTKGDENGCSIIIKVLRISGGDEHPFNRKEWDAVNNRYTTQASPLYENASIKSYWIIDIKGLNIVKIYLDADGGTPTGTMQLGYTLN